MILADTSVWIAYFRASSPRIVEQMRELLEEDQIVLAVPVKMEILCGSSRESREKLSRVLSALPLLIPTETTWKRVEEWIESAVPQGERFGVMDLLIAALSAEIKASLWSLDSDFKRLQKLGFIKLHGS
jgi:predicted nucleic acid-binding protein